MAWICAEPPSSLGMSGRNNLRKKIRHIPFYGTLIATMNLVDKSTPKDLQALLKRLGELEEKIVQQATEITLLKAELARKDKIIAGLQQRLFGSSSEKLDPNQL